jgi:hypothetical protein
MNVKYRGTENYQQNEHVYSFLIFIGFSASLCEIEQPNVCDSAPCQNRGTCQLVSSVDKYKCLCPNGYSGVFILLN